MTTRNARLSKLEILECQRLDAILERLRKEFYDLLDQNKSTTLAQEFVADEELRALSDEELEAQIQMAEAKESLSDKRAHVEIYREWIATQRTQMREMQSLREGAQRGHQP